MENFLGVFLEVSLGKCKDGTETALIINSIKIYIMHILWCRTFGESELKACTLTYPVISCATVRFGCDK
jgi:hypothetical protein